MLEWIWLISVTFATIFVILMVIDLIRYLLKRLWREINDHLDARKELEE